MACTNNPTVNEASEFSATGRALAADGTPLAGATVRLLRYFHPLDLFRPSVDDLFECTSTDWRVCGSDELDFELALVQQGTTGSDGTFQFDFLGSDIVAEQGQVDAMGNREGSFVVIVVIDPNDASNKVGVYTYRNTFSQADRQFGAGDLQLWDSNASVDVTNALVTGEMSFSWDPLARGAGQGSNIYRLEVSGTNTPRFIYNCRENNNPDTFNGDCDEGQGGQLTVSLSAFTIFTFYSNNGAFSAFVQGDGVNYRSRTRFQVANDLVEIPRDRITTGQVWAVGSTEEELTNTAATDDDPNTVVTLSNSATEIYVLLNGTQVSDAGVLNATVSNAPDACVRVEFTTSLPTDLAGARALADGAWTAQGRFCGGIGLGNAISALLNFPTTQVAGWLRFQIESQTAGVSPVFQSIGEVAVYQPTGE